MKKINHVYKCQHRENFLKKRQELRDFYIKYTEEREVWVVEFIDEVNDYTGDGFIIDKNTPELVDHFPTMYTLKYQSKLRILPA